MFKLKSSEKASRLLSCIMALLMVISGIPFTDGLINAEAAAQPVITATVTVVNNIAQPVEEANVIIYSDFEKTNELASKKTDEEGAAVIELEEFDVYYYTVTASDMADSEGAFTKTDADVYVEMTYLVKCRTCDAKGTIICPTCNGTGEEISAVSCPKCTDGSVAVICPACNGADSERCIACNGTGTINEECADCSGTGAVEAKAECSACHGAEKINCTECNGEKYVPAYDDFTFEFSTNPSIEYRSRNNANAVTVTKSEGKITYSSSDDSIVAVDENGNLTAKGRAESSAVITAVIEFDKENGYAPKAASCCVQITKKGDFINEFDVANDLVYNGQAQDLILPKADGDVDTDSLTVEIFDANNQKVTEAVNAGTYTVKVKDDNHKESSENVIIRAADITVSPQAGQEKSFGEEYEIKYDVAGVPSNGTAPVFTGVLSYEALDMLMASDSNDVDVEGDSVITVGSLALDNTVEDNANYSMVFNNNSGIKINVVLYEYSGSIMPIDAQSGQYWYNLEYMSNHDNKVVFEAPEGYKISKTKGGFKNSISFSADKAYEETVYLQKTATNVFEFFQNVFGGNVEKTTVVFGIDTVCPKADYVEFDVKNDSLLASIGRTLTFGTYFNTRIEAKVTSSDEQSGVDSVCLVLNDGTTAHNFESVDGKFVLSESSEPITGQAYVTVTDKAGNKNNNNVGEELVTKDDNKSNLANTDAFLTIENNAPVFSDIEISPVDSARDSEYTYNSKKVYSGDVVFTLTASDADSGLYYSEITINDTDLSVGPYTDKTPSDKYTLSTEGIDAAADGSYELVVKTSDAAGNVATAAETVYVDRHAPIVKSFEITGKTGTADDTGVPHNIILTDYGFYFKNEANVTITFGDYSEENELLSGLSKAKIYLYDKDGTIYQVNQDGTITDKNDQDEKIASIDEIKEISLDSKIDKENNSIAEFSFTVNKNFKGQIYAMAIDNAGNTLVNVAGGSTPGNAAAIIGEEISFDENGFQKPSGSIIESSDKHNKTSRVTIEPKKSTENTDFNGNPLYSDDIEFDIEVEDTYSGIKTVELSVKAPYNTAENYAHTVLASGDVDADNDKKPDDNALSYIGDEKENDWIITDVDENLATAVKNTVKVTNNSNNIVITVKLTDRAGNVTVKDYRLSIDKSAPEIEVTYNNNVSENGNYYQDDRTAAVTIRELNLVDASQINITAARDGADISPSQYDIEDVIKKTYDEKNFDSFHKTKGSDGEEVEYYEFRFLISGDIQGDYHITAAAADNGGLKSAYDRIDEFHVDTAVPFITVTFDNETAKNGNYYSSKRTATITATDRYFDSSKTSVAVSASDNGNPMDAPQASGWSNQNEEYEQSCSVVFDKDGTYSFTVDSTDLSGKTASQYKAFDFVIDLTAPTIKITINNETVQNGSEHAYIDAVEPQIVVEDTNFSQTDTEVTLTPVVVKDGTSFGYDSMIISRNSEFENGMTYDYNNFKGEDGNQRIYDNIYILEASTVDKAGNTTEPQRVMFSVNRYGSTYIYELSDYYIEKPVIQIEEVNVNPIDFDNEETYINVTNSSGITKTFSSKEIIIQTQEATENNWYSYLYAIPSDTFETDDLYSVKLSSVDTAERVSTNLNDANRQEISFTVDTTNPYFEVTNYIENENIKESTYELAVDIMDDTSGVAEYSITFDGEPVGEHYETRVYENKISVKVPIEGATSLADAAGRALKIEVKDAAGRSNTEDDDKNSFNVRISSSFFVDMLAEFQDFYHNTAVFWSAVVGIILVIGVIIWIIIAKKKKSNDDESAK